jgi:hypothetical protein
MAGCEMNLIDTAVRDLGPANVADDGTVLPRQLTSRARHLLERGRSLLEQLRQLADDLPTFIGRPANDTPDCAVNNPIADLYSETTAMVDVALRLIQGFPDDATAQLRLCDGIEAIFSNVAERIARLDWSISQRRRFRLQVESLAQVYHRLCAGASVSIETVAELASEIVAAAENGDPMHLTPFGDHESALFVACHAMAVASVGARVARFDPDYRKEPLRPVLAALLHDVGMVQIPAEVIFKPGHLSDDERRIVEAHPRIGAEILARAWPAETWPAETAGGHHERLDGTGYPSGLRDYQLPPLTRFLMVCDVYAAMISPRPHRPAHDTRTALADTLLLAEHGLLDRFHAERLLQLSFYPIGSVVELADGATGVVVATHMGRREVTAPARPVLALLTDREGRMLPVPQHLDLAQCEGRGILRALTPGERRQRLAKRYPEFA